MQGFRYSSAWLQNTVGLHNAEVWASAQQGCTTMFSALRVARAVMLAEPGRKHALCVGVDVLPAGAPREILYNVISDAACAVVLSRGCSDERWLGYRQLSRGYYWDPAACGPEIVAGYFPTAKSVIEQLLVDHRLGPGDVDVVVPTGVSRASWEILLRLVGYPRTGFIRALLPSVTRSRPTVSSTCRTFGAVDESREARACCSSPRLRVQLVRTAAGALT